MVPPLRKSFVMVLLCFCMGLWTFLPRRSNVKSFNLIPPLSEAVCAHLGQGQLIEGRIWNKKCKRAVGNIALMFQELRKSALFEKLEPRNYFDYFEPQYDCMFKTRIGGEHCFGDGPKWVCEVESIGATEAGLVYSVGSNGDFSFETGMRKRCPSCELHTFDPTGNWTTIAAGKNIDSSYHMWGLARQSDGKLARSMRDVVQLLGHERRLIDVLKIDCEGCEWGAFESIWKDLDEERYRIGQILIELHLTMGGVDFSDVAHFFVQAALHEFFIFSKEKNEGCHGWTPFRSYCVEYSFIHKKDAKKLLLKELETLDKGLHL